MSVSASSSFPAFCVLQFAKDESVVSVQRAFRRRFDIDPPSPKNIRRWYRQFEEKGCLCKGKSSGPPRTSDEIVETVYEMYERKRCMSAVHERLLALQADNWVCLT
ncbi:hypothetical protein J6590_058994 [Homalodisca vitripennis]|nr:hypothetical protein J6590_058994 [Homalodisca vitripennis]